MRRPLLPLLPLLLLLHRPRPSAAAALAAPAAADHSDAWKFLAAYPRHLRVARGTPRAIDGRLDGDPAWRGADWHNAQYRDITAHPGRPAENTVPPYQQADVAALWDDDYLYVAARLRDPVVTATVPAAHNGDRVPYVDNDFEVFIDPSSTTQFYKEYEMNALNATYDVNWGVPDDFGLACDGSGNRSAPYLPTCVNTTSHFYAGNWTMHGDGGGGGGGGGGGLRAATHTDSAFGSATPNVTGTWTVEIAFPIRAGAGHGGLLDTDGSGAFDFAEFDPVRGGPRPGLPRFWAADLSRVGHPRKYTLPGGEGFAWCPFYNCSEDVIGRAVSATLDSPGAEDCAALAAANPTILGSNPHYGCYWEWVLQDVGPTNAYMHRPLRFAFLQFVMDGGVEGAAAGAADINVNNTNDSNTTCGNIAFPARHVLLAVFNAQRNYRTSTGAYATTVGELLRNESQFCREPACAGADLGYALSRPDIFEFAEIRVVENATVLDVTCTARPCFTSRLRMTIPAAGGTFVVKASITQNQKFAVEYESENSADVWPCLF